jgi:hypothetical protein
MGTLVLVGLLGVLSSPVQAAEPSITTVAGSCEGSSNPTFYPSNRRLVVTSRGRRIAVFDPHGSDVKLAWRDAGDTDWTTTSIFDNGSDEVLNDRPASIALDGRGHAWVVWSGYTFDRISPVKLRRLSELNSPAGPSIGPVVTVEPAGQGNAFADIEIRRGKGFIVWLRKKDAQTYDLMTVMFDDLSTPTPDLRHRAVLFSGTNANTSGTLVKTPKGMRVVARAGELRVFVHGGGTDWRPGRATRTMPDRSRPSAVVFDGGLLVAYQAAPYNEDIVRIARFSLKGNAATTLLTTPAGYVHPTLSSSRNAAWALMVKKGTDRSVVSRRFAGSQWSRERTELSPDVANGGDYAWPNAMRRTRRTLRFLVDGERCATTSQANAVLAVERRIRRP